MYRSVHLGIREQPESILAFHCGPIGDRTQADPGLVVYTESTQIHLSSFTVLRSGCTVCLDNGVQRYCFLGVFVHSFLPFLFLSFSSRRGLVLTPASLEFITSFPALASVMLELPA